MIRSGSHTVPASVTGRSSDATTTSLGDSQQGEDHQQVAARIKIVTLAGHYMNYKAFHLIDARSVEYWASLPGHVRDQAFVFELDQGQELSRARPVKS